MIGTDLGVVSARWVSVAAVAPVTKLTESSRRLKTDCIVFSRLLLLGFQVGLVLASAPADADEIAVVQTTAGPVQGVVNATTVAFRGIPYAEPPVGALRWRPPEPRKSWDKVLDATHHRAHCLQFPLNKGLIRDQTGASEDCLFLNVYAPRAKAQHNERSKPVMVWIHGGANGIDTGSSIDPTPLIETGDVVVVSMNYRLGAFGFLAHPALDAEGHPFANYGVMDQQLALKWVRNNIGRFGGDPRNVTIFGLSSGGLDITTHLISPASAGLFDKAIIESGAYILDTVRLSQAEKLGEDFAKRAGCTTESSAATASCLRSLSSDDILDKLRQLLAEDNPPRVDKFLRPGGAYPQMTVDGQILPETQRAALAAGRIHRVPVLLGSTSDEEPEFQCGALDSLRSFSKWVPTYAYEFADPAATPQGAIHGYDQRYLFNLGDFGRDLEPVDGPFKMSPQSRALSEAMRKSWAAFAASGSPVTRELPRWPRAEKGIQRLQPTNLSVVSPEDFGRRHHCSKGEELR